MLKLNIAGCFLLLVGFASADNIINLNNQTDEALDRLNQHLTRAGFGSVPIPPVVLPDIRLLKGVSIGYNSFQRTGDAVLAVSNETGEVRLDLHVGHRLQAAAFGIVDFGDGELAGISRVRNNSFHFALTVIPKPRCRVRLDSYEYEALTNVTFQSTSEKYDDVDISSVFTDHVLPLANESLNKAKPIVERKLQLAICHHGLDLSQAHHLSTVFKASIPNL